MKWLVPFALLALTGCSSPLGCDEEFMEFSDSDRNSQLTTHQNAGWDCDLISSRPDLIFGIATIRDWRCSRCN